MTKVSELLSSEHSVETARTVLEIIEEQLDAWLEANPSVADEVILAHSILRGVFGELPLTERTVHAWFADYRARKVAQAEYARRAARE